MGRSGGRGHAIAGLILGGIGTLILPIVAIMVGLMLPAVQKVRTAAARMSDQNNMKQVGLGLHAEHSSTGGMSQYTRDRRGNIKTGLSWRVEILPFVQQDTLYRRFDLEEPWDGPTNRAVSNTPVKVYTTPFDGPEPSVNTPYRVFVGGGALFNENGKPVTFVNVSDGTSNTIMAVHATEQVPWAAPRELNYDPNGPLPQFGHPGFRNGFNVLLADGSVRFVSDKASERTLRALITRAGGEVVTDDW